jgi:hypothetical protein
MAKESKVTPTLSPNTSSNDKSDDVHDVDEDTKALVHEMGFVYACLRGNNTSRASLENFMETLHKHKEIIGELECHIENE